MRFSLATVVVVAALSCVCASPLLRVALEGDVVSDPQGWEAVKPAPSSAPLTLIFAVSHSNVEELEETLFRVSDPQLVDTYGRHLSMEEVNALVAPPQEKVDTIIEWLSTANVHDFTTTPNGDFVRARTTVGVAEELLGATFWLFRHAGHDGLITRVTPGTTYTVPAVLADHLDFVAPTLRFPRVQRSSITPAQAVAAEEQRRAAAEAAHRVGNGSLIVVPTFLRSLYQASEAFGKSSDNRQGVCSFIQQFWSDGDLQEFFGLFFNSSRGQEPKQVGKNNPGAVGAEASLDVQYLMSVGADVPTWVWYTGGQTPFLDFLLNATATPTIPHLFSISYGQYENGMSKSYGDRLNQEFQKLGARGVSILVASGDSGVGGNCTNNGRFSPDFPASSPYVTAVGGMTGGDAGSTPTGEWADFISGGGFSDFFPRPSYQDSAVATFFKTNKSIPNRKYFNANGAGYPDIGAQSEMFTIVVDRIPLPGVAGTSCATPTASGIFSLLNDLRLQNGKSPLGYLNPFIYQTAPAHANAFNDAVHGTNAGCELFGFTAVPGWDPVTGWGSPNYRILSQVVMSLP